MAKPERRSVRGNSFSTLRSNCLRVLRCTMDQFRVPGFVQLDCFAACDEHVDQNRDPNARSEATNESSMKTKETNCYCVDCARGPLCEKNVKVEEGGHEEVVQAQKASQDTELQQRRPDMEAQQHREIQRQLAEMQAPHDRELHRRRPEVESQRREIQRQVAEMQASLDRELQLRRPEVEAQHREIQRQLAEMQASQYREVQRQRAEIPNFRKKPRDD